MIKPQVTAAPSSPISACSRSASVSISTSSSVATPSSGDLGQERADQPRHVLISRPVRAAAGGRVEMHRRRREPGPGKDAAQPQAHIQVHVSAAVGLKYPGPEPLQQLRARQGHRCQRRVGGPLERDDAAVADALVSRRTSAAGSRAKNSTHRPATASKSRSSSTEPASPTTNDTCSNPAAAALARAVSIAPALKSIPTTIPSRPTRPATSNATSPARSRRREPSSRARCPRPARTARCTARTFSPEAATARSPRPIDQQVIPCPPAHHGGLMTRRDPRPGGPGARRRGPPSSLTAGAAAPRPRPRAARQVSGISRRTARHRP